MIYIQSRSRVSVCGKTAEPTGKDRAFVLIVLLNNVSFYVVKNNFISGKDAGLVGFVALGKKVELISQNLYITVDDCPQKFLDGRDPYMKSTTVYVLSGRATPIIPNTLMMLSILIITIIHRLLQP